MAKKKQRNLVIVESPAKARTLAGLLGTDYDVHASVGHVRDLPKSKLGVDIEDGFAPQYVVPREKRKVVRQLKEAAEGADRVYLATDPDREGEAIAWHLLRAADLEGMPHQRVVFHEITKSAVRAPSSTRASIDMRLVDAQQARRVLDRLVGYKISPLLWKKVRRGLSAGRVQSVALRMVVDREREIEAFVPQEYWTIDAELAKTARQRHDVHRATGGTRRQAQEAGDRQRAKRAIGCSTLLRRRRFAVASVRTKEQHQRPPPPFTTSTLQQEASRRFGFSAKRTMARRAAALRRACQSAAARSGSSPTCAPTRPTSPRRAGRDARVHRRQIRRRRSCRRRRASTARRRRARRKRTRRSGRRPSAASPRRSRVAQPRPVPALHPDLAADGRQPDGGRRLRPDDGRHRGAARSTAQTRYLFRATAQRPALPRLPPGLPGPAEDDEEAEEKRPCRRSPKRRAAPAGPAAGAALHRAAAALHGGDAGEGAGGERHRPAQHLCADLSTIQDRGYVEKEGRALKPTELGFVVNDLLDRAASRGSWTSASRRRWRRSSTRSPTASASGSRSCTTSTNR